MEKELIFDIFEKVSNRSDLDWIEIRDKHHMDCHPDTLRKAGVGIKMAAEAGALTFDSEKTSSYDELQKAKRQFYDQRREYNKLLIDEARNDHLTEELIKAASELNKIKPLSCFDKILPADRAKNEAVLVLSDWHYGMVTDNVWNRYNTDIADYRIRCLMNRVEEKLNLHEISKLHIVVLGDMISGHIHNTCRIKSSEDTVDQLMHVSERLAELIAELGDCVDDAMVYCTYGNHARVTPNLKESIHSDNLERIIPFWMKERLRHRRDIHFLEDNAYEIIRIRPCGHETGAVHGDLDTGKDSILILSQLYQKNFGEPMEYLLTGHMHNSFIHEQLGIEQIGVGCLCGSDEYAKNKRLFGKPSQTFLVFTPEGLDSVHEINLK